MAVTHIAGFPVRIGNKARQLCAWCGERLIDDDYDLMAFAPGCDAEPKYFEPNTLVEVETSADARFTTVVQPIDGDLPRNCCAKTPRCQECGHQLALHEAKRGCHVLRCGCRKSG